MTGPEHYREAEELLEQADALNPRNADARAEMSVLAALAQAHATLAVAAATAVASPSATSRTSVYEAAAWQQAAGTPVPSDD